MRIRGPNQRTPPDISQPPRHPTQTPRTSPHINRTPLLTYKPLVKSLGNINTNVIEHDPRRRNRVGKPPHLEPARDVDALVQQSGVLIHRRLAGREIDQLAALEGGVDQRLDVEGLSPMVFEEEMAFHWIEAIGLSVAGDVGYLARFEMGDDVGCGWLVENGGGEMVRYGRIYSVDLRRCFGETASVCCGRHGDQERFVRVRWCILRGEFFHSSSSFLEGRNGCSCGSSMVASSMKR
ncbi:MAG: hypothetical protein ASARMPRED_005299 [Alectoria sarmentosa]|nr:MAG: hypothetical protein ASARMPRED_005299 [Alectoria sarmentosa]